MLTHLLEIQFGATDSSIRDTNSRLLLSYKLIKRLAIHRLMLDQFGDQALHFGAVLRQNLLRFNVGSREQISDFLINFASGLFAAVSLNLRLAVKEIRLTLRATGQAYPLAHPIHGHHLTRKGSRTLQIILRAGADLPKNDFFSRAAT